MGEVDELDDAVDEGVAERHKGEDQAVGQADDLGLEELFRSEKEDTEDLEHREREDACHRRAESHGRVGASIVTSDAVPERTSGRAVMARPDRNSMTDR